MESFMQPSMNVRGVRDVILENTMAKDDGFKYSGMWVFTGSQGSGKTLLMMHLLKQILDDSPNCIVVSNISIYGVPSYPYKGIEDFDTYNNGRDGIIFVLDEIHTLFNSLESRSMPLSTIQVWSQNRKNRRLILGTTQRFTRAAKGIREQTTYNYECRKGIGGFLYSYRVFLGDGYDDNGKYTEDEPRRHFYVPQVKVMRMYNTLEVIRRENYKNGSDN